MLAYTTKMSQRKRDRIGKVTVVTGIPGKKSFAPDKMAGRNLTF